MMVARRGGDEAVTTWTSDSDDRSSVQTRKDAKKRVVDVGGRRDNRR